VNILSYRDIKFLRWCRSGAEIFSTCGKRQYMAIVTSPEGRVVGTGYNGSPPGLPHCVDGGCPRLLEGSASGSIYDNCVAVHAEANALMFSDRTARAGGTLYVNGAACYACAKLIAGSGCGRLVYINDPSYEDWPRCESLLHAAGVTAVGADLAMVLGGPDAAQF
jgi:dCMP deaminase